jgi:hypothetical protein
VRCRIPGSPARLASRAAGGAPSGPPTLPLQRCSPTPRGLHSRPELATSIAAAGARGRISCFQMCDWLVPMAADPLVSRGMMGDGVMDFGAIASIVEAAGYSGDIEVEIFSEAIWGNRLFRGPQGDEATLPRSGVAYDRAIRLTPKHSDRWQTERRDLSSNPTVLQAEHNPSTAENSQRRARRRIETSPSGPIGHHVDISNENWTRAREATTRGVMQ